MPDGGSLKMITLIPMHGSKALTTLAGMAWLQGCEAAGPLRSPLGSREGVGTGALLTFPLLFNLGPVP